MACGSATVARRCLEVTKHKRVRPLPATYFHGQAALENTPVKVVSWLDTKKSKEYVRVVFHFKFIHSSVVVQDGAENDNFFRVRILVKP